MTHPRIAFVLVACGLVFAAPAFAQPGKGGDRPAAPATPPAAGKVDLRPKFKAGQEVRFRMDNDTNNKGSTPGDKGIKQHMGATLLLRCKDVSPAGASLELVYEALSLSLEGGQMDVKFDSSKPATDDPMDGVLRPIVGTTISLKMDPSGNITDVSGGAGPATEQFTGADVIKNMFGPLFTASKGSGQYSVGESWTSDDTMTSPMGTVHIVTTNTLKSVTGGMANIAVHGTFTLDPSSSSQGVAIAKDSNLTGDVKWDTETGMLDSMNSRLMLNVDQKNDRGQNVRTTREMKSDFKRVKK